MAMLEQRTIGLEQFMEIILPAITHLEREVYLDLEIFGGIHPMFGRVCAVQGGSSAVLIISER